MSKVRVFQLAKDYDLKTTYLISLLQENGINAKSPMSALTEEQVELFKKIYKKSPVRKHREYKSQQTQEKVGNETFKAEANQKKISDSDKTEPPKKDKVARRERSERKEEASGEKTNHIKAEASEGKRPPKQKKVRKPRNPKKKPQSAESKTQATKTKPTKKTKAENEKPKDTKSRKPRNKPQKENPNKRVAADKTRQNRKSTKRNNSPDRNKQNKRDNQQSIKARDNRKRTKNKRNAYSKNREERRNKQMHNKTYEIPEFITVGQLADTIGISANEIIKVLMANGTLANINQQIDAETAQIVGAELGFDVIQMENEDVVAKIFEDYDALVTGNEVKRAPVVTVMGHVDHGKTSLLDYIRNSNVTASEAGGITQHIGAYSVKYNNEMITFIDTPGHAAFTSMRSRGAQLTDIAVLVVAADDGVMPQTIEAINHVRAADVPMIVAINKIDKEGANPDRIKQELLDYKVVIEDWGGETIAVPISAKEGTNIDDLLESILLVAEMEELKADPNREARGNVIEAEVKKGKGSTASLLIKQGTLHVGDTILTGSTYGKVRTMIDANGKRIRKAGPSSPVEISGLTDIPEAGDDFIVFKEEKEARQLAEQRQNLLKLESQKKNSVNLLDLHSLIEEGQVTEVNIIIKADVQGSVEALTQSLERLNSQTDEVKVKVIHGAVGAVNETDVMLASTSNAIIIAFNVRDDKIARAAAEKENVDIRFYTVIYDVINDVKDAMAGLLKPEFVEKTLGEAEVRMIFRLPGGMLVAGSYVTDGYIKRGDRVRLIRDGSVILNDKNIISLRRFKDDVREVQQGYECGIGIEGATDIKEGDVVETFTFEEIKRDL